MHRFEHGRGAATRIHRAVDPRIAVVAHHHPLARIFRTLDLADYIPDDPALVILLRNQVNLHAAGAEMIAEGKRTLPALRHARPLQSLQNGCGIVVADGDGDDLRLVSAAGDAG